MMFLLHGAAGGLDELIIAVVAVGVLWLAVKLAGRKPADEEEEAEEPRSAAAIEEEAQARPPAAPLG
jgi:hypothetical protein